MTVDDPDKVVAVKDGKPAHVVFHEQFRGSTDRLPRCDSDNIRCHYAPDRGLCMVGYDGPHPPRADQVAPGDDPDKPFLLHDRERSEATLHNEGVNPQDLILLCERYHAVTTLTRSTIFPIQTLISSNVRHILLIAMDVAITKMSSKGQVVIPVSMRTGLPEGEKLLVIRDGERIILKPLSEIEPAVREDILFAEKTEQALEDYSKGMITKKQAGDFIDEMKSW